MDKEEIENIVDDCVFIRIKNVPKHMINLDLTWVDKEISKIKKRLARRFALIKDKEDVKKLNEEADELKVESKSIFG